MMKIGNAKDIPPLRKELFIWAKNLDSYEVDSMVKKALSA